MWLKSLLITLLFGVAAISVFADPVTLSFEGLQDGTNVTTQFSGITFSNATVITAGVTLNEFEFPPHSGTKVIFNKGGAVTITFASPTTSFEAYFTYDSRLTLQAFQANGNQVGNASSRFNNNMALSGASGSSPNELISLTSQAGIAKIIISTASSGGSFVLDDVKYDRNSVVANVSAASFSGGVLASESIVAAFGQSLSTTTQVATSLPLPTSLAGTTVKVRDSSGAERLSSLFFVSPTQINYQIPLGTTLGVATVTVTSGNGSTSAGDVTIAAVAPGLFAANANGRDVAAAVALRIKVDGSQFFEPVARFDSSQNKFVPVPIDLGQPNEQVFLLLFGTGIRYRSSLSSVITNIGGIASQVIYAGPQGDFIGLDQINTRVPSEAAGRGEVDIVVRVDGRTANTIKIFVK